MTFNEIVDYHTKKAIDNGPQVNVDPNLSSIKSTLWNTLLENWHNTIQNSNSSSISNYLTINPKLYPATLLQDNKILQTIIINLKPN